jgi:antitoxin MazE
MSQSITKWGQTLAVQIPGEVAAQLHWDEHTEVICTVVDGTLVVTPAAAPVSDLDQLVAGITPENRHAETPTGAPTGHEAW